MKLDKNSLEALELIKEKVVLRGRVVFVSGTFNILHPGHLRLLRFAAECGDYLVVGVYANHKAQNAVLDVQLRLEAIQSVTWVNFAFPLYDSPEDFISVLHPHVVVKGKEHESGYNPELRALESYGGKLLFSSGDTTFSSLELIKKEISSLNYATIAKPADFPKRHKFSITGLHQALDDMRSLKVCVIGDTIVDEYIQCDPVGMSQEDPTIVVTPIVSDRFIGGAAIVAAHASGLGAAHVEFISFVGEDGIGDFVGKKLGEFGVHAKLIVDESRPTTLKQRFRAGNKTLLRVNHLRQHKVRGDIQSKVLEYIKSVLDGIDLLIFSDFNYGALPQPMVEAIIAECQRRGIMMVADSQSSSQVGDISRYHGMKLVTPTEREARLALSNYEDGLVVLAEQLRKKSSTENVVITLGAEGLLIHAPTGEKDGWITDTLPALNLAPKDTAGAGDSFLVSTAMAMRTGRPIWECVYLGSLAAACQVGRVGNIPLKQNELRAEIGI